MENGPRERIDLDQISQLPVVDGRSYVPNVVRVGAEELMAMVIVLEALVLSRGALTAIRHRSAMCLVLVQTMRNCHDRMRLVELIV